MRPSNRKSIHSGEAIIHFQTIFSADTCRCGPVFAFNYKDVYGFGWIVKIDEVSRATTGYLLIHEYGDAPQHVVTLENLHQENMACSSRKNQGIVVEQGVSSSA